MAIVDSTTASPSGARALSITPPPAPPHRTSPRHVTMPCRPHGVGDARVQTTTLYVREGDAFREAPARQVLLQAQKLIDRQFRSRCLVLSKPELLRVFLKIHLGGRDHEVFAVLFLDTQRRLIDYVELFRGTIDAAEAPARGGQGSPGT